jgi:ribonucleoside-diphosphate reductase beta chain
MTEVDVARTVEAADLKQMGEMDIDDVYTLMDVQLRERPGPRELYIRWEKQNWQAYAIDFTEDKGHWEALPDLIKDELIYGLHAFFLGEVCVTDTLSPMVHAAPTDEDRQFLSTQLVDEARHAIFFERFFRDVLGIEGLEGAKKDPRFSTYLDATARGYGKLFYADLPAVTEAVREDPGDYGKWVDSIVMYHMLIEGMLALYGQRQILRATRTFGILPGFSAGFTAVTRDESRHVNYGVYALRQAVERGYADRIVETAITYLDGPCDLLSRPLEKIVLPPEEFLAMIPEELRDDSWWEQWAFPTQQLRKRLKGAGISSEAIDGIDKVWWERIETNLDDYEQTYGEPHPARTEEASVREGVLRREGVLTG